MAKRVGFIAIVGRPNVGKSTLMNRILGQKISITSRRPQTTRHCIFGIKTTERAQFIYLDTPGLHKEAKRAMNRYMNRAASQTLHDADVVLFLLEGDRWSEDDELVAGKLRQVKAPIVVAINKLDKLKHKDVLLPRMAQLQALLAPAEIIPVSARTGRNVALLEQTLEGYLPESHPLFPDDQVTNRSERFLAAEIIREKLMRNLGDELPFYLTVEIEHFKEEKGLLRMGALIWVERKGQKAIVIGKRGEKLKQIGSQARLELETLFDRKVFLELWVRVKEGWSDDVRALRSLGYGEDE